MDDAIVDLGVGDGEVNVGHDGSGVGHANNDVHAEATKGSNRPEACTLLSTTKMRMWGTSKIAVSRSLE